MHFDFENPLTWLRIVIALVWLVFGLVFKALDAVPRHRRIVARVLGEALSGPVLTVVAITEIGIGLWMLWGRALGWCMLLQTLLIVAMNTLEIWKARDLLLSPKAMVAANATLLAIGWYVVYAS